MGDLITQSKAVNGVTCHECRGWIRGGKLYYKKIFYDYHMEKYRNFCMSCAVGYIGLLILKAQKLHIDTKKWKKAYEADDRKICLSCKNKYG